MRRVLRISIALILAITLATSPVLGFQFFPTVIELPHYKLVAGDGAAGDVFGWSVAVSGDTALVGAYDDDDNGPTSGSAYVYNRNGSGWTEVAKLTASDGAAENYFGYSVAIDGDTAVVGALGSAPSGAVYVFHWDGTNWSEEAKLTASDGDTFNYFAWALAIDGDLIVVGAHEDDAVANRSGSAYVFARTSGIWSEQAKLTASDGAAENYFGYSVAIDGDTIVAAAPGKDPAGAVYVFRWDGIGWSEESLLTASDVVESSEYFGFSVALSGDTALVGAPGWIRKTSPNDSLGACYVFTRTDSTWSEEARLHGSEIVYSEEEFGYSVALSGNTALIGAPEARELIYGESGEPVMEIEHRGAAYLFNRTNGSWGDGQKLKADDYPPTGAPIYAGDIRFGYGVSLSGDVALIGAPYNNYPLPEQGAAYVGQIYTGPDLYSQIAELNSQIAALNGQIAEKDSQIEALNSQVAELNSQIAAFNAQIADKDNQIEGLNNQVAELNSQIESMYAQEEYDAAYNQGYEEGLANAPYPDDTLPPAGSIHAYDNYLFQANKKVVDVTLSGYVCDEMSIIRDGGGTGISNAYLQIDGGEMIVLDLNPDGSFSITRGFAAIKDAVYEIKLYATDTNPEESGGPNTGLIDQTYVRVR